MPELKGWQHVVGSTLLKDQLDRVGLDSMDGMDDVAKNVIRQYASEDMLRLASSGCEGFICEGHAALLGHCTEKWYARTATWLAQKVAGKKPKRSSEFVFTELDKALFNEVILVEADAEVVLRRRMSDKSKKRALTLESVEEDMRAEREAAAEICRESGAALRVVDANIPGLMEETLRRLLQSRDTIIETTAMQHQESIRERARKIGPPREPGSTVFLFDADNTLGPHDASEKLLNELDKKLWEEAQENFDRGYSHYSFIMHDHIHMMADSPSFKASVKRVGALIKLFPGVKECLLQALDKGKVVVLTAGVPDVWREVLANHGIPICRDGSAQGGVEVHGLVDYEARLVMDEQGKETFARELRELGHRVVAVGDSIIDTGMLRAAHVAFIVTREFNVYENDISRRRPKRWSDSAVSKKIRNERLMMLMSRHRRAFQIPCNLFAIAVNGPAVAGFDRLVELATGPDVESGEPAGWVEVNKAWALFCAVHEELKRNRGTNNGSR
jgi:phosphoserine phosphatase